MRRLLCAMPLLLAIPAMAEVQYPEPTDPDAARMVERYRKDEAKFFSPEFTKMPATLPPWPCDVPEVDQYKVAGLAMAHPELKKDMVKQTRKILRQMGVDAQGAEQKYSDIQIAPIVAQCKDGKLDGEVEVLVSYRMEMENKNTTMIGEKATTMTSVISSSNVSRRHLTLKDGEIAPETSSVIRSVTSTKMSSDDPRTNSSLASMNTKPVENVMVMYSEADGRRSAMFMPMDEVKVSSGFLVPSIKTQKALLFTFFQPVDDTHAMSTTYMNKRVTAIGRTKEGKLHGEQVTYMDNVYKAMGQRLDKMPGMENAREVVIDGMDLVETRTCFQENQQIKTATCSNE